MAMDHPRVRLIAFYLPQFHPIPENDLWWGQGFTEWTNVAKAKPLFRGHYQPHIPADLGFYDLRVPEVRIAQAEMAREYGIEGFCYWHYWFAGKRLLEQPFNEVLRSGEPDLPFCLAWANESWTGVWHGCPDKVLIEQTYPGIEDHEAHFFALLNAFNDERYMTIEDRPVFVLYKPHKLPDPKRITDCWRELAVRSGLRGLYLVGMAGWRWDPKQHGFDASIPMSPGIALSRLSRLRFPFSYADRLCRKLAGKTAKQLYSRILSRPAVYLYENFIKYALPQPAADSAYYPCVLPNWDNTPRSGVNGVVLHRSTPGLFRIHLKEALEQIEQREFDKRVIFIKSWNEWAEGNYLEPDQRFGRAYLDTVRELVFSKGTLSQGIDT